MSMTEPEHPILVELTGLLRGFDAKITIQPDVRKLAAAVAYLEKQGFEPLPKPLTFDVAPDGKPICPKHKCVMTEREKQGDKWYSHKVTTADGHEHYCRGYAGPDSQGYWFEQATPQSLPQRGREREPGEDDDLERDYRQPWRGYDDDEPRPARAQLAGPVKASNGHSYGPTNGHDHGNGNGQASGPPWARTLPPKSRFGRGI